MTDRSATPPTRGRSWLSPLRGLALAGAFLTRLPFRTGQLMEGDHGWALTWFPVIGLMIGGCLYGVAELVAPLQTGTAAIALVVGHTWLTGALHLDGVADVCDAAGSGRRGRSELLAIMKDPRVGAFGATGLVLALGARLTLCAEILCADVSGGAPVWPIVIAPVASRFWVTIWMLLWPYVGGAGLGSPFKREARPWHVGLGASATAGAACYVGTSAIYAVLTACVAGGALAFWGARRLGGLTGDVYGASIEVGELSALAVGAELVVQGVSA